MSRTEISQAKRKEFGDTLLRILQEIGAPSAEDIKNRSSFTEAEVQLIAEAEARFLVETMPGNEPGITVEPERFGKLKEALVDGLRDIFQRRGVTITS